MKKRLILTTAVILVLVAVVVILYFAKDYFACRRYTENMLNRSVYGTCDNITEMNAMLEKIVGQGYVFETELLVLDQSFSAYINNFYDYVNLTEQMKKFRFGAADDSHEYTFENSDFFYRVRNLYEQTAYQISDNKFILTEKQLEAFQAALQYTETAVGIIKQNIDFYHTYDIILREEQTEEGIMLHLEHKFKEEYLIPWKENRTGAAATTSSDGTMTPVEVPPYDYPTKPWLTIRDDSWYLIMKELKQLNIKEK